MKIKLENVAKYIEELAPLSLVEPWDNSGWQILCSNRDVNKIIIALSITNDLIEKAINDNFDLIITHHPLLINQVKNIIYKNSDQNMIINLIKHDIALYSAHTNLDKVKNGINDILSQKLHLKNSKPIVPEIHDPTIGMGRVGELEHPQQNQEFLNELKSVLKVDKLKIINFQPKQLIKKVALCGGSGASLLPLLSQDVDIFITGDIKYHDAINVKDCIVVDANHYNTENIILETLAKYFQNLNVYIEIYQDKNPWDLY